MSARSRFRLVALLAAVVLGSLTAGGIALAAHSRSHRVIRGTRPRLSQREIKRLSAAANKRSIIIFKNQLGRLPATARNTRARAAAVSASQAGVRAELTRLHARNVKSFSIINAMTATVSAAEVKHLQSNPQVQAVVPDVFRRFSPLGSGPGPALGAMAGKASHAASSGPQSICPSNPAQPLIEPEAREVMNVAAAQQITDGKGVKVGIVADGIDPNNPDLIRAGGQHVIFDYQDFSGFGTNAPTDGREAFLDAGTIASQGNQTYDLSGFVNPAHPLPPGCNIKIEGIAPGASLAVMNLSGPNAGFFNSTIIQGIQWAVEQDHVNVLNESIGGNPLPNTEDDPVALADQAAIAAGVTVVASSGDAGPFNNIGSPATTPGVIAVGGTTTYRVYRQTTRYGTQLSPGGWENNNISALSSDGITEFNPSTVDVVAPGDRGWSLCSSDTTKFFGCADIDHGTNPPPIWAAGGTSASAPETSGTAALVISAYAKTHNGQIPAPQLVKQIIVSSAQDLGAPADRQGAGLVNTLKAVQLAESINGGTPTGNSLYVQQSSLSATVNAGQSAFFNVNVTNEATSAQTVSPSLIGLPSPLSNDTGAVTLDANSPTYIDGEGNTDSYQTHTFDVPAGADYLTGDITWMSTAKTPNGSAVFETLFNPQGQVAAYSLIGSDRSGFGHVEVRQPSAGTWTAVIFTVHNAAQYTGAVQFNYESQQFHSAGTVFPSSRTLAAGQSATFHLRTAPGQAGDESYRLHLGTGSGNDGSVPVVVRSLVPVGYHGGTFSGALTGGGSTQNAGQTFTYQFRVPYGRPSLNVALQLADAGYDLNGFLIDPNGEPVDVQSTGQFDDQGNTFAGSTMQFFRGHPQPGLWTLTLNVFGPVPGTHLSEPYTGTVNFAPVPVSTSGIPGWWHTRLQAGQPTTATITFTNTGNTPKDFFVDPRLNRRFPQVLLGTGANNVPLPLSLNSQPNWLVPPGTNYLATYAQATIPITSDSSFLFGDPDVGGVSFGNAAVTRLFAPEVAPGFFFAFPEPTCPCGADGVPAGSTANVAAVANTYGFNFDVTPNTGDVWEQSVNANAAPYTPISLNPGETGRITVTFTPTGRHGQVVRGFLGLDTFNLFSDSGDEITQIPYQYKIR